LNSIVIVEDELIAAEYLKELLEANGFKVLDIIDSGKEAIQTIPKLNPDIVLMDIMLKDSVSGSEVALSLKASSPHIAILFLTAYTDDEMVEYAINSNSYGYLIKPYNEKEIVNTLRVVSARVSSVKQLTERTVALTETLVFHINTQRLVKDTIEVKLSKKALLTLEILCKNKNSVVSFEQMSMYVWGVKKNSITIRTHIHRMRGILGNDIIKNVSGSGYSVHEYKA